MNDFYQADVTLLDLKRFILKHHKPCREWDESALTHWILFHQQEQFLIATSSDGFTLNGLVIARPIMSPMDAFEHYVFDNEGPIIYVELTIAKGPEVLRGLVVALVHRFGLRQSVAFHRRNIHKLIVRPAAIMVAKVLHKQKEYHGTT
jgi:hypothetical protein